jgi:hypothetical protein
VEPPSHLCGAVVGLLDVVESVARDLVGHVVELYSRPAHLALDHSIQLIAVDLVCLDEELAGTRPNLVVDVGQRLDEVEVVVDRSVAVEELACGDDVLPVLQKTVEVSRTLVSQHLCEVFGVHFDQGELLVGQFAEVELVRHRRRVVEHFFGQVDAEKPRHPACFLRGCTDRSHETPIDT